MKKNLPKRLKIILAILSLAIITWGDQRIDKEKCSSVDLSENFGPLRDQRDIGWCYANVAADLIAFKFKNELRGARVSASYIALLNNEIFQKYPNDDVGDVLPALLIAEYFGVCTGSLEEEFFITGPHKTLREKINNLVYLKDAYDKRKKNQEYLSSYLQRINQYTLSNSLMNKISLEEVEEILKNSSRKTFLRKLANRICEMNIIKLRMDIYGIDYNYFWINGLFHYKLSKGFAISGKENLIKKTNYYISNNKPVSVGYNTSIFDEKGYQSYQTYGGHVSLIVGRRWNDEQNQCEFLLRNSWGINCSSYQNPELIGKCDPKTGYLWLPSEILKRGITEVLSFKN